MQLSSYARACAAAQARMKQNRSRTWKRPYQPYTRGYESVDVFITTYGAGSAASCALVDHNGKVQRSAVSEGNYGSATLSWTPRMKPPTQSAAGVKRYSRTSHVCTRKFVLLGLTV